MTILFINRHNDIDHVVPIAYRLAKDASEEVAVLCINPVYDIEGDFRLRFLKEICGVTVDYAYCRYQPTVVHRVFGSIIRSRYFQGTSRRMLRSLFKRKENGGCGTVDGFKYLFFAVFKKTMFWRVFNGLLVGRCYNVRWAEGLFAKLGPSRLVFDFACRSKLLIVDALMGAARRNGIKVIFVPHGLYYFPQNHWQMRNHLPPLREHEPDAIIVSHRAWAEELAANGIEPSRIHVLGSARYCREWSEILHAITPPAALPAGDGPRLRVLYMERQADRHGKYKDVVGETIRRLSRLPYVHLLIQPSTRSKKVHFDTSDLPEGCVTSVDSVNLCMWADVVICLSSIMFEAMALKKIYINAKFLHGEVLLSELYGAGLTVNSYDELEEALMRISQDPSYRPYRKEDVERFMTDMIYGGRAGRDVLGGYRDLILSHGGRFEADGIEAEGKRCHHGT